jgi:hypothetical protein
MLKWGSGKGSNLRPDEYDNNNWTIAQAILSIQTALPSAAVGIDYFSISGDQLTVHMTDHSLRGPYTLPTFQWNFRNPPSGAWQPVTVYSVGDVFTNNGSTYLVLLLHVSAATFDPNATDGLGHNLYGVLLTAPSDVLPLGGAKGMNLTKVDGHDFNVTWSYTIPLGGTTGQYLAKINGTDFNTHWVSPLLSLLGDVALTTLSINDSLIWNGVHWVNSPAILTLDALTDTAISGQSDGEVVTWDAATSKWKNKPPLNPVITALGTTGSVGFDPTLGDIFTITPTGNVTLNGTSAGTTNQTIKLIVTTSGTSTFNITFGTGFIAQGVLATGAVSGKTFVVTFVIDVASGFYYEMSRTAAM